MTRRLSAWARQRGVTRVGFELFLVVQVLHLGEHVVQMAQLIVFGWPASEARGLISRLDVEKVHFAWNVAVLAGLGWLIHRGVRSVWLLATTVWAVLHTTEHGYLLGRALVSGLESQPGILGAHGLLASVGWTLPGLTTWSRPAVHFAWNVGEVALLGLAYVTFLAHRIRFVPGHRLAPGALVLLLALAVSPDRAAVQPGPMRFVSATDPTCDAHTPCYASIQAAVTAAMPGDTIVIQAGTYVEHVSVRGKNNTPRAGELDRIVIEADPTAPVGSIVLTGPAGECDEGHAIRFQRSKFVTVRGLTITGAVGSAVHLAGGHNQNHSIHLERLRIVGNGSSECGGGISIAHGNSETLIVHSLIHGNGRDGIAATGPDGGPHYIVNNTIHANAWSGVSLRRDHTTFLVNNAITANGTAPGWRGGRFGVEREPSDSRHARGIHLLNNLICGNRFGEIEGGARLGISVGNLTPTGSEGLGVVASPGCEIATRVYADVGATFGLAPSSPAIDRGMDPRTLGLSALFNPLFEADFSAEEARPTAGAPGGTALFDIGAREFVLPDTQAPTINVLQPDANAFVRGTVTVRARASDDVAVSSLALAVDGQPLTAALEPSPPAPEVTATAALTTTALSDGSHTLAATAMDKAGHAGVASRVLIIDNTPPTTQITGGPAGDIAETSVTFTFTGTDTLTPSGRLAFAWSFDGGPFTTFAETTTATFSGLAEGTHTFAVKARDLAGNEDPTPATRSMVVVRGPAIASVDPATGPVGTFVTVTGQRFTPGATRVAFNGVQAVVRSVTETAISTTVPLGATTGALSVTTPKGLSSTAFAVTRTSDFAFTVLPAQATTLPDGVVSYAIMPTAVNGFTGLVNLSVSGLPSDVSASFASATLGPGQIGTLTLRTKETTRPGVHSVVVTASTLIDGVAVGRQQSVALHVLAGGVTALAGRVLDIESNPVSGVTFALAGKSVQSDAAGNFLLVDVPAGSDQFLFIDGSTATPDRKFPTFPALITLESGKINVLPFTPYLHPQKTFNFTTIVPGQETVVTDPDIPGFAMRIPADVAIIGWDGQPNTKVSVRTVPLDRMPLPHPDPPIAARSVYMFYFDKVGGGTPSRPVPVTVLNDLGLEPGAPAELWYYDEGPTAGSATQRWQKAGTGTVSADGKTIATDPGVGLPRFCCGAFCFASVVGQGSGQGLQRDGRRGAEPIDLATGLFVLEKTDLLIPGRLPLALTRTYRNADSTLGPFGRGSSAFFTTSLRQPTPESVVLVEPGNTRSTFTRGADGSFTNETVPGLRGARLTPNADGTVTLRLADGTTHVFEPIGGGNFQLRSIADRNGNALAIARDGAGRPTHLIEPGGRPIELTFNVPFVQVIAARDPLGREVRYTYDAAARLSSVTDPAGGVTHYTYDAVGNLLTITDPRGITTVSNEYSASGRVVKQTQADGGVWMLAYMVAGARVTGPGCPGPTCPEIESLETIQRGYSFSGGFIVATTVTDPRGNATTYRFNNFGEVIEEIDALGQSTQFERAEGTNLLLSTLDALGRRTRYDYDAVGNVVRMIDPTGQSRTFTYEPGFNQMTSMRDELGQTRRFEYDPRGNLVAAIDPLNSRTTLTYDSLGQLTAVTDATGKTHTFSYDGFGHRIAVSNPLGQTVRREFDVAGRMLARIDALGVKTTFAYDLLDRVVGVTDAAGGLTAMTYDANGNLLTVVDPGGNVTTHGYDALGLLILRTDPAGRSETFTYDGQSNLITLTDRNGNTSRYTYDPLNRVGAATYADGSSARFSYDAVGRMVSVSDAHEGAIERRYDALDRLVAETTDRGMVAYRYDAVGRPLELLAPGQPSVIYQWDIASRLVGLVQGLHAVAFDYDLAGRRTRMALPNGIATEYQYDAASRVVGLVYRSTNAVLGNLVAEYDAAGRRITEGGTFARTLLTEEILTAHYQAANRQSAFGNSVMTYDNNGNLTSLMDGNGTTTFGWDARNRLVAINATGSIHTFVYDALGRRSRRISNGVMVDYVHDRQDVIQEGRESGGIAYLRAPWPDEPFMRGPSEFYLLNASGSVIALTDDQGRSSTAYTYEPFGQSAVDGSPTDNPLTYAAREDDGTGLHAYRTRYYSSRLRRFISEDRMGFTAGDPNLYAYVYNNPVGVTDPSGLDATIWRPAGPGRTWKDGPRNGNWGGLNWSGGQGPPFTGRMLPPVDSGDECYMHHDVCWAECARCPADTGRCRRVACNRDLVRCLLNLSDDPRRWARPPRPGTEADSLTFRNMAIEWFRSRRDDVFRQFGPWIQ